MEIGISEPDPPNFYRRQRRQTGETDQTGEKVIIILRL
jgi:hypothetical protein